MQTELKSLITVALTAVFCASLGGCMATGGAGVRTEAAAAPVGPPPARSTAGEPSTRPANEPAESNETENDASAISRILAERRRGDYPEIEMQEFGFTIAEQARISNSARTDYEYAVSLLRDDRIDEGISVLQRLTETTPDATAPYIDLGIAFGHLGKFDLAEEALKTAELLSPENPIVHNELGILYRKTGRFAQARASYDKALSTFDDFHFARRNLAVLCDLYLADLQCALQNYRAYLASVNTDAEVEIWIADIENRIGN